MPNDNNSSSGNNDYSGYVQAGVALGSAIGNIGNSRRARKAAKEMNERNIEATNQINRENREFSKEMWNMTNAYNSPAQQMARYKEAGLNPHLIYGSQPQASQPMSASTSVPTVENEGADNTFNEVAGAGFQAQQMYLATKKQQAEIDNVKKANDVMDADIRQKDAGTALAFSQNARSQFDLGLAEMLKQNVIDSSNFNTQNAGLSVQKLEQDIMNSKIGRTKTEAEIKKIAMDIFVQQKQIEMMQIQGQNLKADNELKQLDLKLKRLGIQPSDNMMFRVPTQIFSDPDMRNKAWNKFKNWFSK